jgi:LacI family transcriptional regulator, galactose operon repressor
VTAEVATPPAEGAAGKFEVVVKLSDVARRAGVGTASRALNGKGYVDANTRERVLAAAAELDYRPNAAARALRERRTRVVGLLLPDISNEFYTASAAVLQTVLNDAGFQLIVATTGNDPAAEQRALAAMLDRQVDGIVHVPIDPTAALPTDVPVVQLNRYSVGSAAPAVLSDDIRGVAELTAAIIDAGHIDLAVVVGPPHLSTGRERLEGYRQAVRAAGIPEVEAGTGRAGSPRSRVLVCPFTTEGGAQAVERIAEDPPQALLALSSRLVMGVLRGCGVHGINIPDDLSLAGLGDPEWFAIWQPAITTFAPPLPEMGRRAAEALLALINDGPESSPSGHIRIPGDVRIRHSVRGLAGATPIQPSRR